MNDHPFLDLVEAYLENRLSPEQRTALEQTLVESPASRRLFWEYVQQHGMVAEVLAELRGRNLAMEEPVATACPVAPPRRSTWRWKAAVGLAAAVLVACAVWYFGKPALRGPSRPNGESPFARVEEVQGEVLVVDHGEEFPIESGQAVFHGQEIQTGREGGFAVVAFEDGTRLELNNDTVLVLGVNGEQAGPAGKRVFLRQGVLSAEVAKQPAGKPLLLTTPHAEVRVLGTRFQSASGPDATRVELEEGRLLFTRKSDGKTIEVKPGSYALAAPDMPVLSPLPLPAQVSKPRRTLRMSGSPAIALALCQDAKSVATGRQDGDVELWDLASGQVERRLGGHQRKPARLALDPTGVWLVTASHQTDNPRLSFLRIWEMSTGKVRALVPSVRDVLALAFAPDGRRLAVAGQDGKNPSPVRIIDIPGGEELANLGPHSDRALCVAFSPDGKLVAFGARDGTVFVCDSDSGQVRHTWKVHKREVKAVAFSSNGQVLASGGQDGFISLFDLADGRERARLAGPFGEVRCLAFSHDGSTLASSNGGAAKLWDVASGREKVSYRAHKNLLTGIAFTPDDGSLITAGLDKTVKIWDVIP